MKPLILYSLVLIFLVAVHPGWTKVIYVNHSATGENNGSNWEDAYNDLQDALAAAEVDDEIWVAAGTYTPDLGGGNIPGDRSASFTPRNGVSLYGGFNGSETSRDERDLNTQVTVLSGDLNGDDEFDFRNYDENVFHVVIGVENVTLDGFTIIGGNANGEQADNEGGGVYIRSVSMNLSNCLIRRNYAGVGGGIMNRDADSIFVNCIFQQNKSTFGGAIYNVDSVPSITNCTLTNNEARDSGGAMYNSSSSPIIVNSIIWNNHAILSEPEISSDDRSNPEITYTCIPDEFAGAGNKHADPLFVSADSGILILRPTSPCIDAGNDLAAPKKDVRGRFRPHGDSVDMGAYEITGEPLIFISDLVVHEEDGIVQVPIYLFWGGNEQVSVDFRTRDGTATAGIDFIQTTGTVTWSNSATDTRFISIPIEDVDANDNENTEFFQLDLLNAIGAEIFRPTALVRIISHDIIFVDADSSGLNNGSSWDDAIQTLGQALEVADIGDEVWVAEGTYTPGSAREDTFQLKKGVDLFGGFNGTETTREQRDFNVIFTTLSGDINGDDGANPRTRQDNAFHVVTGQDGAILDGFHITAGNADESGGGIYNVLTSPTIRNCRVFGNFSSDSGGGMYCSRSAAEIINTTFSGNRAGRDGGALYNVGSITLIEKCRFEKNESDWEGGAVYNNFSRSVFKNSIFSGNSSLRGGGIYIAGPSSPTITNCTFTKNFAHFRGGGIYNKSSSLTVINTILWNDTANDSDPEIFNESIFNPAEITYSCVQGGYSGTGNIDDDPEFLDPASDIYYLKKNSPCIDSGTTKNAPEYDFINGFRPFGTQVDIGAYEFNYQSIVYLSNITVDELVGRAELYVTLFRNSNEPVSIEYNTKDGTAIAGQDYQAVSGQIEWQPETPDIRIIEVTVEDDRSSKNESSETVFFSLSNVSNAVLLTPTATITIISYDILYVKADATGGNNGASWGDAFTNLQDALYVADEGDEIWVAAGTYKPGTTRESSFLLTKNVSVFGGFDGSEVDRSERNWKQNETILSGDINNDDWNGISYRKENVYHVVIGADLALIDEFTILGGWADIQTIRERGVGGGLYNFRTSLTVSNCYFKDNFAINDGGAIYNSLSSLTVTNSIFEENSCNNYGGGIHNSSSTCVLIDSVFKDNTSQIHGGAVYNNSGSDVSISNSFFKQNTAGHDGGGLRNTNSSTTTIKNCVFVKNIARGCGGAINNRTSTNLMLNCTFNENSANGNGGAIFNEDSSSRIVNSILWENTALGSGNELFDDATSHSEVEFSCIKGGSAGIGNIAQDPLFIDSASGVVFIHPRSPCVDAGTVDPFVDTDIRAVNRPIGNGVDMGAYESTGESIVYTRDLIIDEENGVIEYPVVLFRGNDNKQVNAVYSTREGSALENVDYIPVSGMLIWESGQESEKRISISIIDDEGIENENSEKFLLDISAASNAEIWRDTSTLTITSRDIIYVNWRATGENNGNSWGNAYTTLEDALEVSDKNDEIWVASGIYVPGDDRSATFQLVDGVTLYGGFSGNESVIGERDWTKNRTILSGDINRDDGPDFNNYDENIYNVVTAANDNIIDGFIITGGNADGTWPNLNGGGILCLDSSLTLIHCRLTKNMGWLGGALYGNLSSVDIANSLITHNRTQSNGSGGAVYISNSEFIGANCTFFNNETRNSSSVVYSQNSNMVIQNCIVWNDVDVGPELGLSADQDSLAEVSYSCIKEGFPGMANIADDPLFIDAVRQIFYLPINSPCIDKGVIRSDHLTDLLGNPRQTGTSIDMGAFEFTGKPIIYFEDLEFDKSAGVAEIPITVIKHGNQEISVDYETEDVTAKEGIDYLSSSGTLTWSADESGEKTISIQILPSQMNNIETNSTFLIQLSDVINATIVTPVNSVTLKTHDIIYVHSAADGRGTGESWDNAFTNLNDALSAADAGDEIWVAKGLYVPGTESHDTFALKDQVALYGGFDGTESTREQRDWTSNRTILSGDINGDDGVDISHYQDNAFHVVTSATASELNGFVVAGGNESEGGTNGGGGLHNDGDQMVVANCVFVGNKGGTGGAIYLGGSADLAILNCMFIGNVAGAGGAIGTYFFAGKLALNDCHFSNNQASLGAGIYSLFGDIVIQNSEFINNQAVDGGGICTEAAKISIESSTISRNIAEGKGGGLYFRDSGTSSLLNCEFSNNKAGLGGGIYIVRGSMAVNNCVLSRNRADKGGGYYSENAILSLNHSILYDNEALFGSGILIDKGYNPSFRTIKIRNSLILNTIPMELRKVISIPDDSMLTVIFETCNIDGSGGSGQDWNIEFGIDGGGNIDTDPLLTPDYHLMRGSSNINAGMGIVVTPTDKDIDCEIRPHDVDADIGIDEFIDSDSDGLPDWLEEQVTGEIGNMEAEGDLDSDSIPNLREYELSINPANPDTDLDGIWDNEEVIWDEESQSYRYFSDPLSPDSSLSPAIGLADFAEAPLVLAEPLIHSVVGDVDGDGDLDLVGVRSKGDLVFFQNNGTIVNPSWSHPEILAQVIGEPSLGDADGDGDLDVTVLSKRTLLLIKNNFREIPESTQWSSPQVINLDVDLREARHIRMADLSLANGVPGKDGLHEIIVIKKDGDMQLIKNMGTDSESQWTINPTNWAGATRFNPAFDTSGDIDLDGDLDRFAGLNANGIPVFDINTDEHLIIRPRYLTLVQGELQQFQTEGEHGGVLFSLVQDTSGATITNDGRYTAGTENTGVDVIRAVAEDGLSGLVVVNVISPEEADRNAKVLIVVGTRSVKDSLLSTSERLAMDAYVVCRQRGYRTSDICLLAPNGTVSKSTHLGFPIDAEGENGRLETAIKDWASDVDDLILYFVDHGVVREGRGNLVLRPGAYLNSETLKAWLDDWQTQKAERTSLVIIDTCYSGHFVKELAFGSPQRIVMAATGPGALAHFQGNGAISFSQLFWDEIAAGSATHDAFLTTVDNLAETLDQVPLIDVNGDGSPENPETLGELRGIGIGDLVGGVQRPAIGTVIEDININESSTTLWCMDVVSNNGIQRVIAYIVPPTLQTEVEDRSPLTDMASVELVDYIAQRRIPKSDFECWVKPTENDDFECEQTLSETPSCPDHPPIIKADKEFLCSSYTKNGEFYELNTELPTFVLQRLRTIEEQLGYPPRYEADWEEFDTPGLYRILFFAEDNWGMLSTVRSARVTVEGPGKKAIIIECHGITDMGTPWSSDEIRKQAQLVRQTLHNRSFAAEDIQWFGPGHQAANKATIADVLTSDFVEDIDELTLYWVGNATTEGVLLTDDDRVTPLELKGWLDTLQGNSTCRVTVVVETDYSGRFLAGVANPDYERYVVTSTDSVNQTLRSSGLTFGNWFWGEVRRGRSIQQAFARSRAIARASQIQPIPFSLDDNGNGTYEKKKDGLRTSNKFIGTLFLTGDDEVQIGSVSESPVLEPGDSGFLFVKDAFSPDGADLKVTATLIQADTGEIMTDALTMANPNPGQYQRDIHYDDFPEPGRYVAIIQVASLNDSTLSAIPVPVDIFVGIAPPEGNGVVEDTYPRLVVDDDATSAELDDSGQDIYRLWAVISQAITIELENVSEGADLRLAILAGPQETDTPLEEADDAPAGSGELIFSWNPPDTGWYYVQVEAIAVNAVPASYSIGVTSEHFGADGYEEDDIPEMAKWISWQSGEFQEHNFHDEGDEDWVFFFARKDTSYQINVFREGVNCDVVLELYEERDGDLVSLQKVNQTQGNDETITYQRGDTAGRYYIRIRHANPLVNNVGTEYRIRVIDETGGIPGVLLVLIHDNFLNEQLLTGTVSAAGLDRFNEEDKIYILDKIPAGTHEVTVSVTGYQPNPASQSVDVQANDLTEAHFNLTPISLSDRTVSLKKGWNMTSLPFIPRDNRVETVFQDRALPGEVWSWTDGKLQLAPRLKPMTGYWVYCNTQQEPLSIQGMDVIDTAKTLNKGWNLFGAASNTPLPEAIDGPVWYWENGIFKKAQTLKAGHGYWIYTDEPVTIDFNANPETD